MRDLWELLKKVLAPKRRHVCDEERYSNVNGCFDPKCPVKRTRKPLPDKAPPGPPALEVSMAKQTKKDKIVELERELKDLRQQSENQTALLEVLVKEMSGLRRDLAHLLPEK